MTVRYLPGSAKVFIILAIVVVFGIAVLGAGGILLFHNLDKLGLGPKKDSPSESPSATSSNTYTPTPVTTAAPPARRPVVASSPIQANDRTYASYVNRSDVLVLVDYYADWCKPCRMIAPHLSRLAARHGDKVVVLKVNIDREKSLATRAGVRGIPDVRLIHRGQQLERIVGGRPYESFEAIVLKHESKLPAPSAATRYTPAPRRDPSEPAITPYKKDWLPPGVKPAN